ncbi:MAG: transposase [Bacteroidetes bacterium]|nr:MAG: transposase [Bacteroidota bacterium]MBZ0193561.1 transposase [Candidatus Kapabacteria bacterium]QOJ26721.1 MAG: transposase [Ignavibacteria bacterium]
MSGTVRKDDPETHRLRLENQALKEMIADQALALRIKDSLLKKQNNGSGAAHDCPRVCSRGSLYTQCLSDSGCLRERILLPKGGIRGRRATSTTLDVTGRVWTEEQLPAVIIAELEREFVDVGYITITKWLRRKHKHKLLINKKKVYRLMSKHGLLNSKPVRSTISKQWIKELAQNPTQPLTHLEFDIKSIHIHDAGGARCEELIQRLHRRECHLQPIHLYRSETC